MLHNSQTRYFKLHEIRDVVYQHSIPPSGKILAKTSSRSQRYSQNRHQQQSEKLTALKILCALFNSKYLPQMNSKSYNASAQYVEHENAFPIAPFDLQKLSWSSWNAQKSASGSLNHTLTLIAHIFFIKTPNLLIFGQNVHLTTQTSQLSAFFLQNSPSSCPKPSKTSLRPAAFLLGMTIYQ